MDGRRGAVPVVSGRGGHAEQEGRSRACQSASQPPSSRSWPSSISSARPSSCARPAPPTRACARSTGRRRPSFMVTPGARDVEVLRLRPGRGHLQLRHGARRRRFPDRAASPGRPRRRRDLASGRRREDAQRKRLRDALEAAIAFYHRVLTEPRGRRGSALDYLHGRGFTDETIGTLPAGLGAGCLGGADDAP